MAPRPRSARSAVSRSQAPPFASSTPIACTVWLRAVVVGSAFLPTVSAMGATTSAPTLEHAEKLRSGLEALRVLP